MGNIIVTLNSYHTEEVLRKGQGEYLPIISQSGANGAEIRRELFAETQLPLQELRAQLENMNLTSIYSAPVDLYNQNGELENESIRQIVLEAITMGAQIVKFSLGYYMTNTSNVEDLKDLLHSLQIEEHNLQVTIENDQTMHGGNLQQIHHFLKETAKHNVPVKMTFDIGNWKYTGEDVWSAAATLSKYVVYLHFKHVEEEGTGLVTLPLPEHESSDWRKLIQSFDGNIPRAIEFPIRGVNLLQTTKRYTILLKEA